MPLLLVKGIGLFFVRKMLLGLALDLVQDALDKGAAKTDGERCDCDAGQTGQRAVGCAGC